MFNLQGSEIIVILLLALVVLGPEKLPDAIRKFSQTYGELKKMGSGFQSELKSALDEPMRELRETAGLVQRSADPKRIFEEAENEAHLRAEADAAASNKPVNGTSVKKVNQVAQSMARGPIDPVPATAAPDAPAESPSGPMTDRPSGPAAMLPAPAGAAPLLPPFAGRAVAAPSPAAAPPKATSPKAVPPPPPPAVSGDDAETNTP